MKEIEKKTGNNVKSFIPKKKNVKKTTKNKQAKKQVVQLRELNTDD